MRVGAPSPPTVAATALGLATCVVVIRAVAMRVWPGLRDRLPVILDTLEALGRVRWADAGRWQGQ